MKLSSTASLPSPPAALLLLLLLLLPVPSFGSGGPRRWFPLPLRRHRRTPWGSSVARAATDDGDARPSSSDPSSALPPSVPAVATVASVSGGASAAVAVAAAVSSFPAAAAGSVGAVGLGEDDSAVPLSQAAELDEVVDAPLTADIEMLSTMLAEVVARENPEVHDLYTSLRRLGLDRADDPDDDESLNRMARIAEDLTPRQCLGVMRTFALALNLVNAAEVHHRLRVMLRHEMRGEEAGIDVGPLPMVEDSVRGTVEAIVHERLEKEDEEEEGEGKGEEENEEENGGGGADEDAAEKSSEAAATASVSEKKRRKAIQKEIFDRLLKQKVEIVLTAHPTEVNRRTLLRKFRKVTELLGQLDRPDIHPFERSECLSSLRRIVASVWGSDEIRRQKPTPQLEALGGIAIIESVLWDAVPNYLRRLDAQCRISLGKRLPIDAVPVKFASWIGGDRDGNPNVTPAVTREVVAQQRLRAAKLFLRDLNDLYNELAISSRFSDEMNALADTITDSRDSREKYRRVVGHLRRRLVKTVKECEVELQSFRHRRDTDYYLSAEAGTYKELEGWEDVDPIYDSADLMDPLRVMHRSLAETGYEMVADGLLVDIIRRLYVFGMTLVPLDIREESTRHTMAMDAVTRHLGLGSYAEWDEDARLNFLQSELASRRPLFRTSDVEKMGFEPDVVKTLKVFDMASNLGPESLGAYVISQARSASDVLAVMLFQKQFGMTASNGRMMRVVPLFETLNDLTNAADVCETLFSMPLYVGAVRGKQEIMVGYSDSAKDAGRLAACWAQYNSQEKMAAVAAKHNIELTFFHGKGGTVGRGGNPALYRAILSHPPNTINGRFRVTEQGEMITQNFGAPDIAERTLDIYTASVLRESFTEHVQPKQSWRDQMQRVSDVSCAGYRQLVREEPRFVPYFRQATPELELGSLNIGSRPAKRNPKGGIESLRAIPWTFAWTQTRTHLSAWLGVGDGLNAEDEKDRAELREMYDNWPWFRETIDLVAMIMSKTDFSISKNYDDHLVERTDELINLGNEIREKLIETRQSVIDVSGSHDVSGAHVNILRASTKIRNPYVDPINVVQAELLKVLRAMGEDEDLTPEELEIKNVRRDALIVSISGIAQGMRNSG